MAGLCRGKRLAASAEFRASGEPDACSRRIGLIPTACKRYRCKLLAARKTTVFWRTTAHSLPGSPEGSDSGVVVIRQCGHRPFIAGQTRPRLHSRGQKGWQKNKYNPHENDPKVCETHCKDNKADLIGRRYPCKDNKVDLKECPEGPRENNTDREGETLCNRVFGPACRTTPKRIVCREASIGG